jgi:hypothetical protein
MHLLYHFQEGVRPHFMAVRYKFSGEAIGMLKGDSLFY